MQWLHYIHTLLQCWSSEINTVGLQATKYLEPAALERYIPYSLRYSVIPPESRDYKILNPKSQDQKNQSGVSVRSLMSSCCQCICVHIHAGMFAEAFAVRLAFIFSSFVSCQQPIALEQSSQNNSCHCWSATFPEEFECSLFLMYVLISFQSFCVKV